MKDDLVGINALIRRRQSDVVHVRPGKKIAADIVANFRLITGLERTEGIIRLEDHYRRWNRSCDPHPGEDHRQGFPEYFQLGGNLPDVTLAGIADQREI